VEWKTVLTPVLKKNGFHMVRDGREGTLYYVNKGRFKEFYVELCGDPQYSIIIAFNRVTGYVLPERVRLTDEEKKQLKVDLQACLHRQGILALLG
jgi:hypothetical protein